MITRFRLENFKAHRHTDLALHQFTVLVGDNGSGKTSVLEALRFPDALGQMPARQFERELVELVRHGTDQLKLSWEGRARDQRPWAVAVEVNMSEGKVRGPSITGQDMPGTFADGTPRHVNVEQARELIGRSALHRFRADQVAASAYGDNPGVAVAEDGAQTAVVLADLKLADDERFDRIEEALRRLVPSLERLRIAPAMVEQSSAASVRGSKLYFDFRGAKNVPGHHASQGTLIMLALLTVLHGPDRPRVILLDDFDQALHPRAQMELVRMIKELLALDEFKDTQIIATTHSPYVLDEVSPSDVIAFALRDDGTVAAKPLSEHPDAPGVNGSLKAGELWTLDAERDWVR
jgi:predicted ATPase